MREILSGGVVMDKTIDPVLTAKEVAAELRVSVTHAHKIMRGIVKGVNKLPCITPGSRRLVLRSVFEKWKLENQSGYHPDHSEKNTVTH